MRVRPVALADYPMPTYSTVIICRQVVEVVTASFLFLFEDDEWCARVSINLIGQREK